MELLTARLRLRPWTDADRDPFAAMSLYPDVMRYLLAITSRAESDAWIDRQIEHQARHGFCFWAAEDRATGSFVGSVGLLRVGYEAHFTPAVEVGWRIAPAFWGAGLAPEAAEASLRHGFEILRLPEIVANTAPANANSQRVMVKLGMVRDPAEDFDHPRTPHGHPLRRQVLFRMTSDAWRAHAPAPSGATLPSPPA